MARIGDIAPLSEVMPPPRKADEVIGQDLDFFGYEMREGDQGNYAIIHVADADSGEEFQVSCGGMGVIKQLERVKELEQFPFTAAFHKNGRMWELR